ncbi:MAG TPA: tRNA (adenosine(37)-N6)-threonylcarbamoyltransferase complex transferase subunit TsaD [Alphaproteobacteria bacterium]|jgi:N6-L-threonylcarbamoyladenine synthase|nr:tRNA (adenosine(37)-N6)-threonylcarbamoyltransferase complex transferase subunit TsaD [Alphaproteobacteria bacterium]
MKILSIDTSCDETSAAVTDGTKILSNIIWSQASLHSKFGGVMPSLAQRMHEERIDFVVDKAMLNAKTQMINLDAIAVTIGPGLSIALGVGVNKAKELAKKYNKKLIAVNHLEGHVLSPLANDKLQMINAKFPALGLVLSGKNTQLIQVDKIGKYKILAETQDDALGEALDKAARMLGLGYPGGAIFEKMAKFGNPKKYKLPVPMVGQESRMMFSYSGLKTAMLRLVKSEEPLDKQKIYDLAACFQDVAFKHIERVLRFAIVNCKLKIGNLLVGGGVAANIEIRKRLRKLGKEFNIKVHFPYSRKLYGDNAGMIGIAASFKYQRGEFVDPEEIDRNPRARLNI